jgi:hypothetical protein
LAFADSLEIDIRCAMRKAIARIGDKDCGCVSGLIEI